VGGWAFCSTYLTVRHHLSLAVRSKGEAVRLCRRDAIDLLVTGARAHRAAS
jgi:hypothetical protein